MTKLSKWGALHLVNKFLRMWGLIVDLPEETLPSLFSANFSLSELMKDGYKKSTI